jgi:hypothetical protein
VTVSAGPASVTFSNVTVAGTTTFASANPNGSGPLPSGYVLIGASFALNITTTATVQAPITICFNVPSVTDPVAFEQLRILHNENGTLVDRTTSLDFALKQVCATTTSLSPFVLGGTQQPRLQLFVEEPGATGQLAALDSMLLVRDPFPIINSGNLLERGGDRNTRVMIFVANLEENETAANIAIILVDSNNQTHNIVAEDVRRVPGFDFSQVTFKLPTGLHLGSSTVVLKAHGLTSNIGTIRIRF